MSENCLESYHSRRHMSRKIVETYNDWLVIMAFLDNLIVIHYSLVEDLHQKYLNTDEHYFSLLHSEWGEISIQSLHHLSYTLHKCVSYSMLFIVVSLSRPQGRNFFPLFSFNWSKVLLRYFIYKNGENMKNDKILKL